MPISAVVAQLLERLYYSQDIFLAALLMSRIMPLVLMTPFWGGKLAPPEIKMGFGVLLTIAIYPFARAALHGPIPMTALPFIVLMLKEVFVGFCLGLINTHVYNLMDMAGRMVDTARGTSMAEVLDPVSQQRETIVGNLYTQLFLVVFVGIGGHHVMVEALYQSFVTLPVDSGLPSNAALGFLSDRIVRQTADILMACVLLSAPVMAATFITDLVFGILNRVAPQLNAYFMATSVKGLGATMLMIAMMVPFVEQLEKYVIWSLKAMEEAVVLLGPR